MSREPTSSRALRIPEKRLSRLGGLSAMTAGVAGNMALGGLSQLVQAKRPTMRDLLLTPKNITRITEQLAQMRGAAMKIGQLVSMDTGDVLPPELTQIMARLRNDAHFMPAAQLKQVLNAEWGHGWLKSFKSFDIHPIAAASIGQVHRAVLKDGRVLAIKVQYPGVAKSIDSDVANVGALIKMSGLMPKGFELAPYMEEARKQLHQETDYEREARYLSRFNELLSGRPNFTLPELIEEWSTSQVLCMSYVAGTDIERTTHLSQDARNEIASTLIELTLEELFSFGVMQTDPNFANYLYDEATQKVVLLDFGATQEIGSEIVTQYRDLFRAGLGRDIDALQAIVQKIGFFTGETKDTHKAQITAMIKLVFDAITQSESYEFTDGKLQAKMQDMGMKLANDGFIPPPLGIDVLLLQRKFGGMFLLANRLGAQVDLKKLIERSVA
jgi:predicted unusual protein kinase regulating ubiquinone biosynthesis (AarF/ABC1/UbiB family)